MQRILVAATTLAMCLAVGTCFAQSNLGSLSLCQLQARATEGTHIAVQIAGIYSEGIDMGVLSALGCSEGTWVELVLQSQRNKNKMSKYLHHSNQCFVVFEGELYGPPVPDSKLPDSIRNVYHPGWGHLGAFRTKLVVRFIREARPAPKHSPSASG